MIAGVGAAFGLETGLERLLDRWSYVWDYSHGYLVVLMSVWLFHNQLAKHPPEHIGPSVVGVATLAMTVLAYTLVNVLDFTIAMQVLLPVMVAATVFACGGWQLGRLAVIPAAFLYFAVPLWDRTIAPLQDIATVVVKLMLDASGIPAHVEGTVITISVGAFVVAKSCSGMTFLVAGLSLAMFYALNWHQRWRDGITLILVATAVALVANWVRIYSLVVVGHQTQMEHYLIVEDHELYGWVLYAVMMSGVIWFARWQEVRAGIIKTGPAPGLLQLPSAPRVLLGGAIAALLLTAPMLVRTTGVVPEQPELLTLRLDDAAGWQAVAPQPDWQPQAEAPQQLLYAGFRQPGTQQVDVYVARYGAQLTGSKVNTTAHDFGDGWQREARRSITIDANGTSLTLIETVLAQRGERRLVWVWYRFAGRQTASATVAKLLEIPALLKGRRDGAVLALSARCDLVCDGARADLETFTQTVVNALHLLADEGAAPGL